VVVNDSPSKEEMFICSSTTYFISLCASFVESKSEKQIQRLEEWNEDRT
jgi:hypothetical protein